MDKEESDQLNEIRKEVESSHAQLGVINERTRNIEKQFDKISEDVSDNESDINDLEDATKRNTTILTGVTGGSSMILLWLSDKVTRIL